jgi:hypothetical protein
MLVPNGGKWDEGEPLSKFFYCSVAQYVRIDPLLAHFLLPKGHACRMTQPSRNRLSLVPPRSEGLAVKRLEIERD